MGKRRKMTKATRTGAYAAAQYLNSSVEKEVGVQIPFDVYLQDPLTAETHPMFGFDEDFHVVWEPGLTDGPTSARFAVVDYNGDTGRIAPKAVWDEGKEQFLDPEGKELDKDNVESLQFHQVNVWAILQRALAFFEDGNGLGRRIPFGFEGNRLIVVPHAGYGKNAFYDRKSKSLQFYYFDEGDKRVYTCLSTDIINHEFGHAVLDGVRPYFFRSSLVETGAFHEFMGDITAILITLRNNVFRHKLVEKTDGTLSEAKILSGIAEEFGTAVSENPYLRTAQNKYKMPKDPNSFGPHRLSEVLTGAMFDILLAFSEHYIKRALDKDKNKSKSRKEVAKTAFYNAINQMHRIAIQPLDLLPPVDVTFKDYANAVLRSQALGNPTDPYKHYDLILKAFRNREIFNDADVLEHEAPKYLYDRISLDVFHDIDNISRSRAGAYRFLDDNRNKLLIPFQQDIIIADLYDANKLTREARRLPRQIILEYIWSEEIILEGPQFGEYQGERTTMLCGGTLVFDDKGSVLSWFRKPGSEHDTHGGNQKEWIKEVAAGKVRRVEFLEILAERIKSGHIGSALGSSRGMLGTLIPPLTVQKDDGILKFELSPHLSLKEDHKHSKLRKRWEVSS